jgi:gliding motility-associated-like protein
VTAADSSFGYYTSTGTELGTNQGLLLTTGKAEYAFGPNNSIGFCDDGFNPNLIPCDYFDNNFPGSALLNQSQDRVTFDATTFEFDIKPQGDSLKFKYIFASEEYMEWAFSPFKDAFGFYISGPGIGTDVNIAIIPGTSDIVSIPTVNAVVNNAYYYNNQNPLGQFIQYDGFTLNLEAKVGNLIPCETYHLKLIIADGSDRIFDSGVFIQAIESNPVAVVTATSNGLDYMVEGCNVGSIEFTRPEVTDQPQTIQYWVGGSATSGIDYEPSLGSSDPAFPSSITIPANESSVSLTLSALVDNLEEGQEYITIYLENPLCTGTEVLDSVNFYIYDLLEVSLNTTSNAVCIGQCITLTGTTIAENLGSFVWSPSVPNPNALVNEVCPTETTTYSITSTVGDCVASAEVTVEVSSISINLIATNSSCSGNGSGTIMVEPIGALLPLSYSWTGPDGFTSSDEALTNLGPGTYCVEVTDAAGCVASDCVEIFLTQALTAQATLSDYNCHPISCFGACDGSIDLNIEGGQEPYTITWTGPDFQSNDQNISGLCPGDYNMQLVDALGCEAELNATLTEPEAIEIAVLGVVDLECSGVETGGIWVDASGGCPIYTYQWSHNPNLTGPIVADLASGTYTVNVLDQNGCSAVGSTTIEVNDPINPVTLVIDEVSAYPNGFGVTCPDATDGFANITVANGTPGYTYAWLNLNTDAVVATSQDLANVPCGEYLITVTDGNDCSISEFIDISCVPIIQIASQALPNPCGAPEVGAGSINILGTAGGNGGPFNYTWSGPSCPCAGTNLTGLNSGDYIVTVADIDGCTRNFTINVGENDSFIVEADVIDNTCNGACDGQINLIIDGQGSGGGGGGDSFPEGMMVDANTQISVCFTGTHTWVSDLEWHLIGPAGCGSPDVILGDQPGSNCNSGDNFTSLCFSTESSLNFNVCGAAVPLTGTYGSQGAGASPINWAALNGCDASEPGWRLEVWDCIAGDSGTLTGATMSFTGINNSNDNATIDYSGPSGITGVIGPLSCGSGITATYTAPGLPGWFASSGNGGGGTDLEGFTFEWSGPFEGTPPTTQDATGLCAGEYTVVVSSGDCIQSFNFEITEPIAIEIIAVDIHNPLCFGQNDGYIDIDVVNGSGDYSFEWMNTTCFPGFDGANSEDIFDLNACDYTVVVTDNQSGCIATATFQLTAPEVMTLSLGVTEFGDGNYFTSCSNANDGAIQVFVNGGTPDPIAFAPYDYQYDWVIECSEIDPAGYGNNPNADYIENLPGGSYGLNVYDANGCLATTCIDLLPPPPLASDPMITNIDCNNPLGSITPNVSGGPAGYILVWQGNIGSNNPNAPTLVDLEAGTYTLFVTADIGTACVDTFSYVIEETTSPIITILEQSNVTCNESCDAQLLIDLTEGVAPYILTLNGDTLDTSILPVNVQNICFGNYDLLVIDAAGCATSTSLLIDGPEPLNVNITSLIQDPNQPFDIQCYGDSVGSLVANTIGGTGVYIYEWTNESDEVIGTEVQLNNLQAGTYCVTITDESGCTTSACYTLTQPEQPLNAIYTTSIYHDIYEVSCQDAADGNIDVTITGGTPGYSFNWLGNGVDVSSEDQTALGVGLYEVLIVDSNSCTITLSINLTAPDPVLIGATLSQFDGGFNVPCNGDCDGTIDANIVSPFGNYTFAWSGPDGFVSSNEDLITLCAGDYTITLLDSLNCLHSNTFTIAQPEILEGTINSTLDCTSGSVQLCVTVTGGSGNYSYLWETGTAIGCIDVTEDGNYCVDINDSNGCAAQICADADPSVPYNGSILTTTNATCGLCNGAIDINVTGGTGTYDFDWTGNVSNPADEDQEDLCEGNYSVLITDGNDCIITLSSSIEAGSPIDLSVSATNVACFGASSGSVTAQVINASLPLDVQWTDANNNPIGEGLTVNELPAGTYIFSYIDAVGCTDSEPVTVTENGALDIAVLLSLFGEYNISEADGTDGSIDVTVTGGTSPYEYQWTPAVGTTADNEVSGLIAGTYNLVVVDENGCSLDTTITLTEPEYLGLPTGLSPNGDGMNDFYVIPGVLKCENSDFKVFNRWGNVVYESTDYHNEWYGQATGGGVLADGTYFVIFHCGSEEFNTYVDLRRE